MNLRQLQYAVQLAEVRSFSQLAENLNISQPALSKHIQALESELGVKLFDRNTSPLVLTPAGESFLGRAKDLLYRESQLLRCMEEYRSGEAGQLTIGVSPFRSTYLMPRFLSKLRSKYPGLKIVLHEASSDELRKGAAEGKYDFAVVNLPVDEAVLEALPIKQESLVLAVPLKFCGALSKGEEIADFSVFKDIPFVAVSQFQEMRCIFDKLCEQAGFIPDIAAEVIALNTAKAMVCEGIGAAVLPEQLVKDEEAQGSLLLFPLGDKYSIRQPVVVYKRGQYISQYADYAIDILQKL